MGVMKPVAIAAVLLCLSSCCSAPSQHRRHATLGTLRWEFREERASAAWCALYRTGPRFTAALTPSGVDQDRDMFQVLFDGPVRITIRDSGVERYAWNGFDYSVWAINRAFLVYPKFTGGVPGGSVVAVDLETGAVAWETPLGHPPPQQGWSFWLNRKTIDISGGRVLVWSLDGGRFLETFDLRTGRSQGWRAFSGRRASDDTSRDALDADAIRLASLSAVSFVGGVDFPSPPLPRWLVKYLRHLASASGDPLSLVTFRDPDELNVGTVEVWGRRGNDSHFEFRYVPYEPGQGTGAIATRIDRGGGGRIAWTPLRGGVSAFGLPANAPPVPGWAKVAPEQIAAARKHGIPVAFENDLGMRFVLIPAGTFSMGSPSGEDGRDKDENPHEVTVSRPYYMSIHEVTNRQCRAWRPTHDSGSYDEHSLNGDDQPGVPIDWGDAAEYAMWLTDRDPKHAYRLPTEAEWERACRAGTRTAYCFGDRIEDLPRYGNFSDVNDPTGAEREDLDDGHAVTAPVGSYRPNRWGLYDLHGNAWEWCSDWYAAYPPTAITNPQGPTSGTVRVYRGGCWRWFPKFARSAKRRNYTFEAQMRDIGFRLVSPLPEK